MIKVYAFSHYCRNGLHDNQNFGAKKLISQGAHDLEIEECAVHNGMTTLNKSCFNHILKGHTTIEEFVRVLGIV